MCILLFKDWKINTLSSKSMQIEKAKSSHFDRTRGDKNQIFPSIGKKLSDFVPPHLKTPQPVFPYCTMFKKINTYLLLHWEEAISMPSKLTSANGEPEAKMALPLVHLWAYSAPGLLTSNPFWFRSALKCRVCRWHCMQCNISVDWSKNFENNQKIVDLVILFSCLQTLDLATLMLLHTAPPTQTAF